MREIKLTQGKIAIVDDEDFERLNQFKWFAYKNQSGTWYAGRNSKIINGKRFTIRIHREIMNALAGVQVDHVNGDGLFNCKENLRLCTHQQNGFNKINPDKDNKLGIKGVYRAKGNKKCHVQIRISGKKIHLGYFNLPDEADQAYCKAEVKYFGEFARETSKRYVKILSPEYQASLAG